MIRFAEEKDLGRILDIYGPYVRNTTHSFEYKVPDTETFTARFRGITAQFPWLVWEEDGQVLGYAYASAPFERTAYQWCCELSVYLEPKIQGRGIGRRLYQALEHIVTLQGYQIIYAIVTTENTGSLAFHEKVGYRTVAVFPGCGVKFGRRLGTVWLEKSQNAVEIPTTAPVSCRQVVESNEKLAYILDNLCLS